MIDYKKAAQTLGVEEAAIKAVATTESNGDGFILDPESGKHLPKILFERHVFFKRLRDFTPLKSAELMAKYPDIVNSASGGYKGGMAEHQRLDRAVAIDRKTALESASWGGFQVLGLHWQRLGYPSVQSFVNDSYTEEGQLNIFVKFIQSDKRLVKALKEKDWTTFASIYNGPNYYKNSYDTRMKEAYNRYSKNI